MFFYLYYLVDLNAYLILFQNFITVPITSSFRQIMFLIRLFFLIFIILFTEAGSWHFNENSAWSIFRDVPLVITMLPCINKFDLIVGDHR